MTETASTSGGVAASENSGGDPYVAPGALISSNDRAFVCSTCKAAAGSASKLYYNGLNGVHGAIFNWSSSIMFGFEFLHIDRLQADVSRVTAVLERHRHVQAVVEGEVGHV